MTNCFPRLFVACGPKRSSMLAQKSSVPHFKKQEWDRTFLESDTRSRLRTILWILIVVLISSLIPPFSQQTAVAQTTPTLDTIFLPIVSAESSAVESSTAESNPVPDGCIDDKGNAIEPLNGEGAWAIILNFNHAASTTETIACLAVVTSMDPEKTVEYNDDFRCAIVNNIEGVEVGHGKAAFDGNFKIECPAHIHESTEGVKYNKFYVHARARFPEAAATYTLIEHSDVHFGITYEQMENSEQWNATLTSRYGNSEFENSRILERIPQNRLRLISTILGGEGTHHVNRTAMAARTPVGEFGFDFNEPIQIGGDEPGWVLYNLTIDPPEPEIFCC